MKVNASLVYVWRWGHEYVGKLLLQPKVGLGSRDNETRCRSGLGNQKHMEVELTHAGDVILFNGLTFHRTFSNSKMTKHRDALLLRIVNPKHVANFPSGPHLKTHERFFAN